MTNAEFDLAEQFALYTRKHCLITGKAGTGKTTLLKRIVEQTQKNAVVVAPTGVAAINAGGVTIHSMFGLPLTCGWRIAKLSQNSSFSPPFATIQRCAKSSSFWFICSSRWPGSQGRVASVLSLPNPS